MRKIFVGAVGAVALLAMGAGTAQAISYNLVFDSGCSVGNGTSACTWDGSSNVVIDYVIIQNVNRNGLSMSAGLDLSGMGLTLTDATAVNGTPPAGGASTPINAVALVTDAFDTQCAGGGTGQAGTVPGCDAHFSSFGFLANPGVSIGAGQTWTAGTITLDLTGANAGTWTITTYQRSTIDAPAGTANPRNFATLEILAVPEPGTASLLGLGLLGLVMAGRRARS
jgi:hypothetical protein